MAGEIVKWFQNEVRAKEVSVEEALDIFQESIGGNLLAPRSHAPAILANPPRIDLLRICAHHGAPWASVYQRQSDGSYRYSESIQITKVIYRTQYAPGTQQTIAFDQKWVDIETCAYCGSNKKFQCGVCKAVACAGRSNGRYFRCHCGAEGWAVDRDIQNVGIVPRMMR